MLHIHPHNFDRDGIVLGDGFEQRGHRLARFRPTGPKLDQYGFRRFEHFVVEVHFVQFNEVAVHNYFLIRLPWPIRLCPNVIAIQADAIRLQSAEDAQERQVGLGGGFVQPLHAVRPCAVIDDIGQMSVQCEGKKAGRLRRRRAQDIVPSGY